MLQIIKKTTQIWKRAAIVLLIVVLGISYVSVITELKTVSADSNNDSNASVQVLTPTDNEVVSGVVSLKFYVQNLSSNGYMPFWAVDNGQWNLMGVDSSDSSVMSQDVNVSSWNWSPSGNYTISLIALKKSDWQPIKTNVTVHIGQHTSAIQTNAVAASNQVSQEAPAISAAPATATLSSSGLYTDPTSTIATNASSAATADPNDAKRLNFLASQPIANWYGDWETNVQGDVNNYVTAATTAKQLPVLVTYDIPERDCGGYSSGGASSASAYISWMNSFAAGIGQRQADVILEPDAVAGLDCLSQSDQAQRLDLISQAVTILKSQTQAKVYIDAGNPDWQSPALMASRLKQANIANADGFSLNISNFITTNDNITYGNTLSGLIGGKHFIIDTSRNGNGPTSDNAWCNPTGRAVGVLPTLSTGNSLVDAFLWIKGPGASDGTCGEPIGVEFPPAAGIWWQAAADELLGNAGY